MSGVVGLIRRGFHEVPHLMFGGGILSITCVLTVFASIRHIKYDKKYRNWKRRYVVCREEDFDPKKQVHPIDRQYPIF